MTLAVAPAPPPVDNDDAVLGWWEQYDAGREPEQIAQAAGVSPKVVTRELKALDVLEEPLLRRAKFGRLDAAEQAIMDALAKVGSADDTPWERREVPWARSMQHTTPKRGPVVQSERQRRLDRMASSKWRAIVRADMRRAGLIP
jgi:hypothetical protein